MSGILGISLCRRKGTGYNSDQRNELPVGQQPRPRTLKQGEYATSVLYQSLPADERINV